MGSVQARIRRSARRGAERLGRRVYLRLRGEQDLRVLRRRGLEIGQGVYIGPRTVIDWDYPWLVSIGDHTTLSLEVMIFSHDASTKRHTGYTRVAPVRIGADVFVGARVVILPGVTIGDGAIVGAGSVVRHDVAPGTIVAGNPARVIASTADYVAKHRARLATGPVWDASWVGIDVSRRQTEAMSEALRSGEGYVL